MHILLIEDSSTLAQLFQVQLRQLGCELTAVETKQEALDAFKNKTFDFVFIDMGLEGLPDRGLEILTEMKALAPTQRIGILSSNDSRDMIRHSEEKGAEFYMIKPFTMQGLTVVLTGDKETIRNYQPDFGEGRIILLQ